jgi:hypothetical protein
VNKTPIEIDVSFTGDNRVVTVPDCETARILVGDTLTFRCAVGTLEIHWQQNVFDQDLSFNDTPVNVVAAGRFSGVCKVTLLNGKPMDWKGGGLIGKSEIGDEQPPPAG